MQQIIVTLTNASGVVITKNLVKPQNQPVQLSLPPGTQLAVQVKGPSTHKGVSKGSGAHKLDIKRLGDDLVIEGEGDALVQVANYYDTKDVSLGKTHWDLAEPVLDTDRQAASEQPADKTTQANHSTSVSSAQVASAAVASPNEVSLQAGHATVAAASSTGFSWTTLALGLGAAAGAGGGGGGGGSVSVPVSASNVITGTIAAGPVVSNHSLVVNVYQADGTWIGPASVNSSGQFTANLGNYSGVVIVKVTSSGSGGDFKDEATGVDMHLDATLLAVGSVTSGSSVLHVNPLTTLAAQQAGVHADGSVATNLSASAASAANAAVAKAFGLSGDITQMAANTTVNAQGGAQTPNEIGLVLAAVSGMSSKSGSQSSAITDLFNMLGPDGKISDLGVQKLLDGAMAADPSGALAGKMASVISKGQSSPGFTVDALPEGHVLSANTLKVGTVLSGKVAVGTDVNTLSIQFGVTNHTQPGAGKVTLDTTTWTWHYTLGAADVSALQGELTQNKDGPESIQLCVSNTPKASMGVFYNNGIDDAPVAVTFANVKTSVAENASTADGIKLADIVIVDPDRYVGGAPTVSDSTHFEVRNNNGKYELWLLPGTVLNFDTTKNLSVSVTAGGTASQAFNLQITDVNYAPVASGSANLASVNEDTASPAGATVSDLFANNYSNAGHDAADTLKGIAVSGNAATSAQGRWQWSSDGVAWTDIANAGLSDTNALYLDGASKIRFVPALNYNGTPGVLEAHLVDSSMTSWSNGTKINAALNGGVTPVSAGVVSLSTSIQAVNDAPTVAHAPQNQLVVADNTVKTFQLAADAFADADANDTLTFTATLLDGSALPSWLTFDASTRTFSVSKDATAGLDIEVRVTASDRDGAAVHSDFRVQTIAATQLTAPTVKLFNDSGTDPKDGITNNGKVLVEGLVIGSTWQYSLDGGGTWKSGSGDGFTLTQDGAYNIQVKQTYGASTSDPVTLNVTLDTKVAASSIAGFDKTGSTSDGIQSDSLTDVVGTGMTHIGGMTHIDGAHCALIEGTSEALATVTFTLGGESKTVVADANGYWNYRMTASDFAHVGVGSEAITITGVTDRAGNTSSAVVTHNVTFNAIADTANHQGTGYGSTYLDALIQGGTGWTGTTITYSFAPGANGTTAWTATEKTAMANAFHSFENICNLHFVEGTYSSDGYAATNMVMNKVPSSTWNKPGDTWITLADFMYPQYGVNEEGHFSDYYGALQGRFNYEFSGWKNLTAGGMGFDTLIHELGHGLGLSHPFDSYPKFPGVTTHTDLGDYNLDQGVWTMMSYNHGWPNSSPGDKAVGYTWGYDKTPMSFDVAALQTLYGANTNFKTGNDTYVLPTTEASGTGWECIWDAGGVDTISNAGASTACQINLNAYPIAGGVPSESYVSYNYGAQIAGGFTIAAGAVIENAVGGNGNDILTGNAVANTLTGGAGSDVFVFNSALGSTNIDQLTDFKVSDGDQIDLDHKIFSGLSESSGSIVATEFLAGANVTAATNSSQHILYNSTTGALYYDADGSGSSAAVQFALLQNKPTDITYAQFVVI